MAGADLDRRGGAGHAGRRSRVSEAQPAPPAATTPADSARVVVSGSSRRQASASFGDADHGIVVFSPGPAPTTTFLTSDGGKTWRLGFGHQQTGTPRLSSSTPEPWWLRQSAASGPPTPGPSRRASVATRDAHGDGWLTRGTTPGLGWPTFLDTQHAWWIDRVSSPDPHTPVAIWRTTDGGTTWHERVASGLPATRFPRQPVFTDPLHGALLFIPRTALSPP